MKSLWNVGVFVVGVFAVESAKLYSKDFYPKKGSFNMRDTMTSFINSVSLFSKYSNKNISWKLFIKNSLLKRLIIVKCTQWYLLVEAPQKIAQNICNRKLPAMLDSFFFQINQTIKTLNLFHFFSLLFHYFFCKLKLQIHSPIFLAINFPFQKSNNSFFKQN